MDFYAHTHKFMKQILFKNHLYDLLMEIMME